MSVIEFLEQFFQRPRGKPLIKEVIQWIGWFVLLGVFVYLNTWLTDRYGFLLVFLPLVAWMIGIHMGYRSGAGYWMDESPEEEAIKRIQRLSEDFDREKDKERAHRFGFNIGAKLRRK